MRGIVHPWSASVACKAYWPALCHVHCPPRCLRGLAYLGMPFMYCCVCIILCSSYQNKWTPEGRALVEEHDLWQALVPPGTLCPCQNMLSWGYTALWYQLEGAWMKLQPPSSWYQRTVYVFYMPQPVEKPPFHGQLSYGCTMVDHSLVLPVLCEGGVAAPICLSL